MIIASHRRSGTHLLIESLRRSFGKDLMLLKTHGLADEVLGHRARMEIGTRRVLSLVDHYEDQPMLYIVRDPRDTLTSNFHWWQTSGESRCGGIAAGFRDVTPHQWITGRVRVDRVTGNDPGCGVSQAHIDEGMFSDPVGFWKKHVTSYLDEGVAMVRYEDLSRHPARTLRRIGDHFSWKRPWWPRKPFRLVGHEPRRGVIGDHRNLLEPDTVIAIEERAGPLMQRLGYLPGTSPDAETSILR